MSRKQTVILSASIVLCVLLLPSVAAAYISTDASSQSNLPGGFAYFEEYVGTGGTSAQSDIDVYESQNLASLNKAAVQKLKGLIQMQPADTNSGARFQFSSQRVIWVNLDRNGDGILETAVGFNPTAYKIDGRTALAMDAYTIKSAAGYITSSRYNMLGWADSSETVPKKTDPSYGHIAHGDTDFNAIIPDAGAPTVRLVAPFVSTRASKTTSFKVKWSATDTSPSAGIKDYTVRYRPSTSSSWQTWKANTTATEANFAGKAGVTYYFRATATDNAGNTGTSKVYKTIVPFNEGNSLLRRIGFNGYKKLGKSQNYLTSVRYSYQRGHTLIYKLYKTDGIGLVVTKGPKMGRAKIYVDGKYAGIVDASSSKIRPRQLIFYRNLKKKGTHYLKVVNLGTPGRARFEVDGVVVGR